MIAHANVVSRIIGPKRRRIIAAKNLGRGYVLVAPRHATRAHLAVLSSVRRDLLAHGYTVETHKADHPGLGGYYFHWLVVGKP